MAVSGPVLAQQSGPVGGWQEAVISVRDLDGSLVYYQEVGQFTLAERGSLTAAELAFDGLPEGASGEYALIGTPGTARGYIRLVEYIDAGPREMLRLNGMPWDIGGYYSVMVRTADIAGDFTLAQDLGGFGYAEPVTFALGDLSITNIHLRDPDGVIFGVYQRNAPALPAGTVPEAGWSEPFNAMVIVEDRDAAQRFFAEALDFELVSSLEYLDAPGAPNNFGMPINFSDTLVRQVAIMHPANDGLGRIELLEFDGWQGVDVTDRAKPPHIGIMALRFPVRDLDATLAKALANGAQSIQPPRLIRLSPYGDLRMARIAGPSGMLIDLFEVP